jgi:hypothetical protein
MISKKIDRVLAYKYNPLFFEYFENSMNLFHDFEFEALKNIGIIESITRMNETNFIHVTYPLYKRSDMGICYISPSISCDQRACLRFHIEFRSLFNILYFTINQFYTLSTENHYL